MKKPKTQDVRRRVHELIDQIDAAYLPMIEERLDSFAAKTEGDEKRKRKKA